MRFAFLKILTLPAMAFAFMVIPQIAAGQCDGRYQTAIFESMRMTTVKYGENINSDGQLEELFMDIYEPVGDTELNRPAILLAHGGAFMDGFDRTGGDVMHLIRRLALMGFVCASFDYRDESNPLALGFPEIMIKAIGRAAQDGKAAVRFFKKSAEEGNPFGIDPDQIAIGGVSAGAILSLNLAYVTRRDMLPYPWNVWNDQIGGLEGNSGNPGYDNNVIGIINISGALGRPYWINGNNVPILNIHGTSDPIIRYGTGSPFGIPWLPKMYGSKVIQELAEEAGISSTLITYPGRGHVPYFNYLVSLPDNDEPMLNQEVLDSTIRHISAFVYSLLDCNPDKQVITGITDDISANITIYPNPSSGWLNLSVPDQLIRSNVFIYSANGSVMKNTQLEGTDLSMQLNVPPGIYLLQIIPDDASGSMISRKLIVTR